MKLSHIAAALGEKVNSDLDFKNVVIDSRKVEKGSVFVAIRGENFDGHSFITQAVGAGACAVVSEVRMELSVPVFIVKNTREALLKIAGAYREYYAPKMIAITGSVGKTSTKEILYSVLNESGKCLKNEANLNNEIGVALTLLRLDETYEYAVIEMGMDKAGEIDLYSKYTHPDLAIITNIGSSHIGNLGSRENIFKAKTEILPYIKKKTVVVWGDDEYLPSLKHTYDKVITYGRGEKNDLVLIGVNKENVFTAKTASENYHARLGLAGAHNALNALAAIAVAEYLGLSKESIVEGLKKASSTGSRMNVIKIGSCSVIDDAYNASKESISAALDFMDSMKKPEDRVCTILGDVFEMGSFAEDGHKKIGDLAAGSEADTCIFIGENSFYAYESAKKNEDKECFYFKDKESLFEDVSILKAYDIILLKASRSMEFEKILERIKDVYTTY